MHNPNINFDNPKASYDESTINDEDFEETAEVLDEVEEEDQGLIKN